MADTADAITLSEDGFSMPTVELLTGRGFITGKSGSGKSNTTSVIAEELLACEVPLLIVDTDGEYYGLKEEYELLHVGGDEYCDLQVTPAHAEKIAGVALDRQVPVILDISGFRDPEEGRELVGAVAENLFVREKTAKTPFLFVVEEAHEFMPEQGGLDDVGETLIRVAKRGRKRGLGIAALSQRPASVSKDYITQCDWLVWHRLTWENDTQVVSRILGNDAAEEIQDLDDGEAIVMTDWDGAVQRVKFRRKHTFDAGATPDLDSIERPDLKSVDGDLLADLAEAIETETFDESESTDDGDADGDQAAVPAETVPVDDLGSEVDDMISSAADSTETTAVEPSTNETVPATADPASDRNEPATQTGTKSATPVPGTGGQRRATTDPANDPAWEAAQFLTYVERRFVSALGWVVGTIGLLGQRVIDWVADRFVTTPVGRSRVESALPKIFMLLIGILFGIGLAVLLR